jgi:molecular chaperone GrpE
MRDESPELPAKTDETSVASPSPPPAESAGAAAEDWATRYKYLLADFENSRRRSERERETITRQARAGMLRELLPILEAFRAARDALAHLPASDPVRKGLEILDREWMTFLKHEGVEPVATVGRPFHAEEAEAVGETDAGKDRPDGTVAEVIQQGYRFFGGLLRPAKVIVARDRHREATEPVATGSDHGVEGA